jgi:acyl-CoA synthetase (AMP-forming)/AMP-acid ligase II
VPLRNSKGFCILADVNEPGLAIAYMNNKNPLNRFDGYSDNNSTKKKILENVFAKGDKYFNSGDLLYRDNFGFFFWSDRVGDTFRWKGENVSTTEVENAIGGLSQLISEVVVYGVEVPNCDGKVGMASISLREDVSTTHWHTELHMTMKEHLPVYARPVFFRIQDKMQVTSTFKHQKADLVKDSYNPTNVKTDPLYFYSTKDGSFVSLDEDIYNSINNGSIKF